VIEPKSAYAWYESQALLHAVTEELKLPLLHIARSSELALLTDTSIPDTLQGIQLSATTALQMLDTCLLGIQLATTQQSLAIEPVSVPAVLYDTAHELTNLARRYNVELELQVNGGIGLVMAHPRGLQAALYSLGVTIIEAVPTDAPHRQVVLEAHRSSEGVVAGLLSGTLSVSSGELKKACQLYGHARQPLQTLSPPGAAGIFVAHNILQSMAARLRTFRHHNRSGLAAVLPLSRQLQLI